jgi:hypothetical protein
MAFRSFSKVVAGVAGSLQEAPSEAAWEGARAGVPEHSSKDVPRGAWGRARKGVWEVVWRPAWSGESEGV